jgi:hypothetical protein
MAFVFKLNNYLPNDGPLILYEWKEFMKMLPPDGPGWQVSSSSDGISFSSNSDIIVSPGFDAGGISNEYSWFVITAPSGRQLVFQLTSEPSNFFIGYSKSGAYTGGSTTTRPTATDECILLNNGGFLAASGFETSAYPKCIVHFGADTSGANSFYILPITTFTSSKVESGGLFMDEINPVDKSNTNIDPVIFYIPSTSSFTDNYSFDSFGQNSRDISTFSPKIITKIMEGTYLESFSLINGMRFYDYHYDLPGLIYIRTKYLHQV